MRDYRDAKVMARALRDNLKAKELALSVAESLELMAKQFGFNNWNVLAAKIAEAEKSGEDGHVKGLDSLPVVRMSDLSLWSISPFFIVRDVPRTLEFYGESLGFSVVHASPQIEPFFAIVRRDGAQLFIKSIDADTAPLPNSQRHPWARWDAYVNAPNPDRLAEELAGRNVSFSTPLKDTNDGLRGFEITDPDGYVLFFGRPAEGR